MKSALKFGLLGLVVLILVLFGTVAWLLNDEPFLRRQVEAYASKALDRDLTIGGLELDFGKLTSVRVRNLKVANSQWAMANSLVTVENASGTINLAGLIAGELVIEDLQLEGVRVNLEEDSAGRENWVLGPGRDPEQRGEGKTFRWGHLDVADFELTHSSPGRTVPLDFTVSTLVADHDSGGRIDLRGDGVVSGYVLNIDGYVDPRRPLFEGGAFSYRLSVGLGENKLQSEGVVDDVETGSGANIQFQFSGPDFAWLLEQAALPEISSGAFDVNGTLGVANDQSLEFDFTGDLGSLKATTSGTLNRLQNPDHFGLRFDLSGPDLKALGEVFDVHDLPALEYSSNGELTYSGSVLTLDQVNAEIGKDRLAASGQMGSWPALTGTDLEVSASGPDLSIWGPAMSFEHWSARPFSVHAKVVETNGAVGIEESRITVEGAELALKGRLIRTEQGFQLDGVEVQSEENTLAVDGLIAWDEESDDSNMQPWTERLTGSHLAGQLDLPSARSFGNMLEVGSLPDEPFNMSFQTSLGRDGLSFNFIDGNLGDLDLEANGSLPQFPALEGTQSEFELALPSLILIEPFFEQLELPDLPLTLQGKARWQSSELFLEAVSGTVGDTTLKVDGEVAIGSERNLQELDVQISSPSLGEFKPYLERFGDFPLPPDPVTFNFELGLRGETLAFTDIFASTGESTLTGDLSIRKGDIPEIRGSLDAEFLDLQWLGGDESEEGEAEDAAEQRVSEFFDEEPLTLKSENPMLLEVSLQAGSVQFTNARLSGVNLGFRRTESAIQLQPLELKSEGAGMVSGSLSLVETDGRIQAEVKGTAEGFKLGIAVAEGQDVSTIPAWDFRVDVTASGASAQELATSAVGDLDVIVGEGNLLNTRLNLVFSDMLSELFTKLNPFVKSSQYTQMECGVAVVKFVDGEALVDPLILQTDKIVATSTGAIDLETEKINLGFNTRPRRGIGISPGAVINPFIKLGGTLAQPTMTLDAANAAITSGAAVATGGLSLLGKSLFDRFLRERDPCGKVVAELRKMQEEGEEIP